MKPARYQELSSRLFEGELSDAEAEELAGGLRLSPPLREELRGHLVLWETWSQAQAPERSAPAFVSALKTRFRAEKEDPAAFSEAVRGRLLAEAGPTLARPREEAPHHAGGTRLPPRRSLSDWIGGVWLGLRRPAGIVACLGIVGLVGLLWMAVPRSAQAVTTIQGEAVCTACVLHESQEHQPAIRVTDAGHARIYYLERNGTVSGHQDRFCGGPTPATATGKAKTERGRLRFNASSLALPDRPPQPVRENEKERVILVI